MKIKKLIGALTICLATGAFAQSQNQDGDFSYFSKYFMKKNTKAVNNQIDLLFVENAQNARISTDSGKKGCLRLTLWPIKGRVHYFSDQPVQLSGVITAAQFVSFWKKQNTATQLFQPNVAIEGFLPNHHGYSQSASLTDALYNAQRQVMTFIACPMTGHSLKAVSHMTDATIFFDNFVGWPPI